MNAKQRRKAYRAIDALIGKRAIFIGEDGRRFPVTVIDRADPPSLTASSAWGGVQRRSRGNAAELETVLRYGVGTTEYMRTTGGYALTLECGQHEDPAAPEVAYRAIVNTLTFLKLIEAPEPAPVPFEEMEALQMVVVHDKLDAKDEFTRAWASFDPVAEGEQIGVRADGTPVVAEFAGRILFPDTNAGANQEWYYMTRPNPDFGR